MTKICFFGGYATQNKAMIHATALAVIRPLGNNSQKHEREPALKYSVVQWI
jgi:hypothetical protein